MTTLARISWNLPPEDLLDADYIPSLWAVRKIALLALISIILGPMSLAGLTARDRWFTATSPTHHESENRTSDILSGAYFSAYGGRPDLP